MSTRSSIFFVLILICSRLSLLAASPYDNPGYNYAVVAVMMKSDGSIAVLASKCDSTLVNYDRLCESSPAPLKVDSLKFTASVTPEAGSSEAVFTVEPYGWTLPYEVYRVYFLGTQSAFGDKSLGNGNSALPPNPTSPTKSINKMMQCTFTNKAVPKQYSLQITDSFPDVPPTGPNADKVGIRQGMDEIYIYALDSRTTLPDGIPFKRGFDGAVLAAVRLSKAMFDASCTISIQFDTSTVFAGFECIDKKDLKYSGVFAVELSNQGVGLRDKTGALVNNQL